MELVKITTNRQVTIPKKLFDRLDLNEGDYLQVEQDGERIIFRHHQVSDDERSRAKEELFDLLETIWERNKDVDLDLVKEEVNKAIQEVREEKENYGDGEE